MAPGAHKLIGRLRSGVERLDLADPAILQTYVDRFRLVFRTRLTSVVLLSLAVAACGRPATAAQFATVHLSLFGVYIFLVEWAAKRLTCPGAGTALKVQSAVLSGLLAAHGTWLALHVNAVMPQLHDQAILLLIVLFILNGLQVHLTAVSFVLSVAAPIAGLVYIAPPQGEGLSAQLWGGAIFFAAVLSAAWRQQLSDRQSAEASAKLSRRNADLETALAAADAANKAKSDFLANVSHEIRTPMNGVVAVADLLGRKPLKPDEREMVEVIRASADTLQKLLDDVLDLARIESGKMRVECAPFHLGELVRVTMGLFQPRCEAKGVRLSMAVDPQVDRTVAGDQLRVRQVLTNLLSNAAKFTETGQVTVSVGECGPGRVRIAVTDTGVGFDMAIRDQLLSRFQQADMSTTRRFGGAGLGLAISKQLVELMGGAFDCDSRAGEGSTFWFEVPLAPVEGRPTVEAQLAPPSHLRVLMADDHPTNRKVVELILGGSMELTAVENGAEAVAAFEPQRFDLVLMDMQMPVMDGLAAVRGIRRREAALGLARTPIIMLTANTLPEHVAAAEAAGADLHLSKPITAERLFEAITLALDPDDECTAAAPEEVGDGACPSASAPLAARPYLKVQPSEV